MDQIGWIRRLKEREKKSVRQIARMTGLSRNTVAKWLQGEVKVPKYERRDMPGKLDAFEAQVVAALKADARRPLAERRTARALLGEIRAAGYQGGYSRLTDFIRAWRRAEDQRRRHMRRPEHVARLAERLERAPGCLAGQRSGLRALMHVVPPCGEHLLPGGRLQGRRGDLRRLADPASMALRLQFERAHNGLKVTVGRALLVVGAQTRVDAAEMEVAVHRRQGLVRAPLSEHGADIRQLLLDALPQVGEGRIVQTVAASLVVGLQDCVDPAESQLVELLVGQRLDGAQLAPLPAVFQPLVRPLEAFIQFR